MSDDSSNITVIGTTVAADGTTTAVSTQESERESRIRDSSNSRDNSSLQEGEQKPRQKQYRKLGGTSAAGLESSNSRNNSSRSGGTQKTRTAMRYRFWRRKMH